MKQSTVIGRAMAKTLWPLTIHSSPSPSRRHATHAPTVVDCSYSHYSTMLFHLRVPLSLPFTLWLRLYPTPVPTCPPAQLALESTFIPLRCVFSIPPTSSGLTLSVHICVYSILHQGYLHSTFVCQASTPLSHSTSLDLPTMQGTHKPVRYRTPPLLLLVRISKAFVYPGV